MIGIFILGMVLSYLIFHNEDSNTRLLYGTTGLPKNCRAIIKVNVDKYQNREYKADEIIDSINRNCGEFGYSWNID